MSELKGQWAPIDELGRPLGGPGLLDGLPRDPAQLAEYQAMLRRKAAIERENTLRWLYERGGPDVPVTDPGSIHRPTPVVPGGAVGTIIDAEADMIRRAREDADQRNGPRQDARKAAAAEQAKASLSAADRAAVEKLEERNRWMLKLSDEERLKAIKRYRASLPMI